MHSDKKSFLLIVSLSLFYQAESNSCVLQIVCHSETYRYYDLPFCSPGLLLCHVIFCIELFFFFALYLFLISSMFYELNSDRTCKREVGSAR